MTMFALCFWNQASGEFLNGKRDTWVPPLPRSFSCSSSGTHEVPSPAPAPSLTPPVRSFLGISFLKRATEHTGPRAFRAMCLYSRGSAFQGCLLNTLPPLVYLGKTHSCLNCTSTLFCVFMFAWVPCACGKDQRSTLVSFLISFYLMIHSLSLNLELHRLN